MQISDALHRRLLATCARLEHLVTLEIRPLAGGLPAGIVAPTAAQSRAAQNGTPVKNAVDGLLKACTPASRVLVVTGAGVEPALPGGETDGPLGALVLARGIARGTGAKVTVVCEARHAGPVEACLAVLECETSVALVVAPDDIAASEIEGLVPEALGAVIFVEKDGPNEQGNFHGIRGNKRPAGSVSPLYMLADIARGRGGLTIGVGDGGNEVGFGKIRNSLMPILPREGKALSADEGVVTVTETDVLVTASVSNWGAYAINAGLAVALGRPELLHTPDEERALISAAISGGARDGATSRADLAVDGISNDGNSAVVALMQSIVSCALAAPEEIKI
jgi:hypothetical protein